MQAQAQTLETEPPAATDRTLSQLRTPFALPSPWFRQTLRFLDAWTLTSGSSITLRDLAPLFARAPIGALAVTVDELCRAGGLVPVDDATFRIGTRAPSIARSAQH